MFKSLHFVSLSEIKQHLRIIGAEEEFLLHSYALAAEDAVKQFTKRDWAEEAEIPASVKAATLLLIGDLYENREGQAEMRLYKNETVERLLWPYRNMEF
jgi:uncharacterized phage protein (predicted DNA packaging)